MKENEVGVEDGFYQIVADMLQCGDHAYEKFPFGKRTRWNNRHPGNGRYISHGIIRFYSSSCIHVILINPRVNGIFTSTFSVLEAIKTALEKNQTG